MSENKEIAFLWGLFKKKEANIPLKESNVLINNVQAESIKDPELLNTGPGDALLFSVLILALFSSYMIKRLKTAYIW